MATYTEPTWGDTSPDDRTDPYNAFLFDRNPYHVMGGLTRSLRDHFMSADNILVDSLKEYIWTPDPETTHLQIDVVHKLNLKDTQRRPALMVERGEVNFDFPAMGGAHTPHFDEDGYFRGQAFTALVKMSLDVRAIGQSGAEAELLLWEAATHLMLFRGALKERMRLGMFNVKGTGKVEPLKENKDLYSGVVSLVCGYSMDWNLNVDGPVLKRIMTSVNN